MFLTYLQQIYLPQSVNFRNPQTLVKSIFVKVFSAFFNASSSLISLDNSSLLLTSLSLSFSFSLILSLSFLFNGLIHFAKVKMEPRKLHTQHLSHLSSDTLSTNFKFIKNSKKKKRNTYQMRRRAFDFCGTITRMLHYIRKFRGTLA